EAVRGRDGSGGAGRARSGVAAQRSAEGERGRDRRDGYRQGLPQRRGGEADEGVRRAQLHSGEETEGAAELGGQAGGAPSGVCEPAAGAGRVRQESIAAARRVRRAQLRALLRDGRNAALPLTGPRQHLEAAVGSCGCVQPEPDPAPVARRGHAARAEKPLWQACFVRLFTLPGSDKPESALRKPDLRGPCQVLRGIAYPAMSSPLQKTRHLRHGLLGVSDDRQNSPRSLTSSYPIPNMEQSGHGSPRMAEQIISHYCI